MSAALPVRIEVQHYLHDKQLVTQPCAECSHEPSSIQFVGGKQHGKRMADFGWTEIIRGVEVYRRTAITIDGRTRSFLVFFGYDFQVF